MNIKERENALFLEWKEKRPDLVKDGVVDEKAYEESNIKLLFVMKEVNDPKGGNWDLREFLRQGALPQTWNNITRWVYGIRNLDREIDWDSIKEITEELRKETLNSICVMNLKKSPGGHTTDNDELSEIAKKDEEYLKQQFDLYNPDIVVCCGSITSYLFQNMIFKNELKEEKTNRGITFYKFKPNKFAISFSHPEARVQDCLLYYGLIDAVKEIWVHTD